MEEDSLKFYEREIEVRKSNVVVVVWRFVDFYSRRSIINVFKYVLTQLMKFIYIIE